MQQLHIVYMSSNNVGHLITKTITTMQKFATPHDTSPNYTSLFLSTLPFLSFTLHYPLIWLNPFTFPIVLFPLTSPNQTRYSSHLQTYFRNNEPLHCLKNLSPFHFTSLFILFHFFHLSYQPFTSLHFAIHIHNSLSITSLSFTFYFLSPSLPLAGFLFHNPRFENMRFTVERPYRPFR